MLHGDTQVSPRGLDTYGSRSLVVGGIAVVNAADKVIEKAKIVAAHHLEASVEGIEFDRGEFTVRGTDKGTTLAAVAFAAFDGHNLPDAVEPGIDAEATFDPENLSFPHGTHLAAIEVDTDTGRPRIRTYVCVDDIGTVVNPLIVEGQVRGGLAQGVSQALFEQARHDESGTLTTASFLDYTIPSAADLPTWTTARTQTAATSNSLGVKGVGEAGTIASTSAIVNAIGDALKPRGVDDVEMPCTPQRIWWAIQAGGRAAAPVADLPTGEESNTGGRLGPGGRLGEDGEFGRSDRDGSLTLEDQFREDRQAGGADTDPGADRDPRAGGAQ